MPSLTLNDRKVASLKVTGVIEIKDKDTGKTLETKPRTRQDYMDSVVPGFGVRVTNSGQRTYILAARFPGSKNYTRREIGEVGAIDLKDARAKARGWIEAIGRGKDPAHEEERIARAEAKKRENTFKSVAESFISEWVIGPNPEKPRQRKHAVVARVIRKHLIEKWDKRPIADIERGEIVDLIKAKAKITPAEARNLLGIAKSLFSWALDQNYGLDYSPCTDIKPGKIVGEKVSRDRALDDDELKALWIAAGKMGNPVGPVYRVLILSGLRLNEVARATWDEINLPKRQWLIPASRMKGKDTKAKPHLVPLTDQMIEILGGLHRFPKKPYVFTTTQGKRPVSIGSKIKEELDAKLKIKPWVNHDIRRTVRSNLAKLKIAEEVSEAVLAHVQPGIKAVYNVHKYQDEKLDALEKWGARVIEIVGPPEPTGTISLSERRAKRNAARA
jgi:integrase